tara:strand:+ start:498 stop:842 length:345 start_codon:yes stop_codon:yes gene_type:complete
MKTLLALLILIPSLSWGKNVKHLKCVWNSDLIETVKFLMVNTVYDELMIFDSEYENTVTVLKLNIRESGSLVNRYDNEEIFVIINNFTLEMIEETKSNGSYLKYNCEIIERLLQ